MCGKFGAGSEEIPRGKMKIRPDLFSMDYMKTLNIGDKLNLAQKGKQRAPTSTYPEKRER